MFDELKKLIKHTTIYGTGSLLGKAVGFLLIPFYTHYLRPAEYGTLELLDLTLSFVGLLVSVWVTIPLVRFYYDYEDETEKKKVVSTTILGVAVAAALIASAGLVSARGISNLLLKSTNYYFYVRLISISFFLSCINSVAWNYLRARERSALIVSCDLVALVVTLSLNIYFIASLRLGVLGVLYGSLIGSFLVTTIITFYTLREVHLGFDFQKLKKLAVFGAPLIFTNVGAFILNFSDRFFLQRFSKISVVGVYALGYKFGFMLSFLLIQPFSMIWSARMYEIAKRKDAREVFPRFAAYFSLILATGALGVSLVIKDVIAILAAPDFRAAYRIVPLVALAYLFQGMGYYFQTGILIQKKTVYMGIMGFLGMTANLLLNYLLIRRYEAAGAAWATVLSFLLMAVLAYSFSQRTYPIRYQVSRLCLPVVVAIPTYLASTLVTVSSPILSIPIKLLFVPIFLAAIFLLGFFEKDEVTKFRSILAMFLARYRWGAAILPGR